MNAHRKLPRVRLVSKCFPRRIWIEQFTDTCDTGKTTSQLVDQIDCGALGVLLAKINIALYQECLSFEGVRVYRRGVGQKPGVMIGDDAGETWGNPCWWFQLGSRQWSLARFILFNLAPTPHNITRQTYHDSTFSAKWPRDNNSKHHETSQFSILTTLEQLLAVIRFWSAWGLAHLD